MATVVKVREAGRRCHLSSLLLNGAQKCASHHFHCFTPYWDTATPDWRGSRAEAPQAEGYNRPMGLELSEAGHTVTVQFHYTVTVT